MNNGLINELCTYTDTLCQQNQLVGISIAIISQGKHYQAASGMLNLDTEIASTTDSVFQIGSITKVFTTTLIMQLVDQGRVNLDCPVIDYLSDFKVGSDVATRNITVRQLLNHTSGLEGDFFAADKPSGGNQLARFVDRCDLLPQSHPPGEGFAYSNTAFCIAGRLLEVVTGKSWHKLIQQNIVEPLGLEHVVVNGPESSRFRVARGHVSGEAGELWTIAHDGFPRGMDPVGSFLAMSATDVVRFGQAHLDASRGKRPDWLSKQSAMAMQGAEVSLPPLSPSYVTDWGLGWSLYRNSSLNVFGHDGGTVGQCAMLRIVPEHDLIFAVLINCDVYMTLLHKLFNTFMADLVGVDYTDGVPGTIDQDLATYCGQFKSIGQEYDIYLEDDILKCRILIKTSGHEILDCLLTPINQNCFAVFLEDGVRIFNVHFIFDENCSEMPTHLSAFNRLNRRVSSQ